MLEKEKCGYFDLVRTDVLRLLPSNKNWMSVLEIGCGEGLTLAYLKDNYTVELTTGVEIDSSAANSAGKRVDRIFNGSAEDMVSTFLSEEFDLILCLDVLEHLYDPWKILRELETKLEPGGFVLASIPNVQHWSVVTKLLAGKWYYTKAGLLDETHIRFFTEKTVHQLFEQAHLNVIKCDGQMGKDIKALDNITLRLFHGFLSYQYFVLAQKSG